MLKNKDGSIMFDPITLELIGIGSSSLFVAFIEYAYSRKKELKLKPTHDPTALSYRAF